MTRGAYLSTGIYSLFGFKRRLDAGTFTVTKVSSIFKDVSDEYWKRTMEYFANVPELNYMTQIVLMLYEDPQADKNSDKRFHIELHFSPGVKCCLEETIKDPRSNLLSKPDSNEDDRKNTEVNVNNKKTFRSISSPENESLPTKNKKRGHSCSDVGELQVSEGPWHGGQLVLEAGRRNVSPRRIGNRSMSECEDPVKLRDVLDVLGPGDASNSRKLKCKAVSKSLGKTYVWLVDRPLALGRYLTSFLIKQASGF